MASNYGSVLDQLRAFGLQVVDVQATGRIVRCKVEGDREKRGWYILHEISLRNGDLALVGSYGIWHGAEHNAQRIELDASTAISADERQALAARIAADKKRADADQSRRQRQAALRAESTWRKLALTGHCAYLERKGLHGPIGGVRFTPTGALVIPVQDAKGRIHGLQFILDKTAHKKQIHDAGGRDKQFWPPGAAKKGHFFLMGLPVGILLIAEGYATAASLHTATGLPVAVVWDAGNIAAAVAVLAKEYPKAHLLICADNDDLARCGACQQPILIDGDDCPACGQPHKKRNAGLEAANLTAIKHGGKVLIPHFADPAARLDHYRTSGKKLTDFNDLACAESLAAVTAQIDTALTRHGWQTAYRPARALPSSGGGETQANPVNTLVEMLERFACIYGSNGNYFDLTDRIIIGEKDLTQICQSRDLRRAWHEHRERKIVKTENVGFDPSTKDPLITCNLWGGWPTQPVQGGCDHWLAMLTYMCSGENNAIGLAAWVIKWLAYQIQNPGAKMQTAIVLYGPQGTGKNLLFEYPMRIFGRYGATIGQHAMEDKFNDWASGKMFIVCNEVVSSGEKYHVKNALKGLITDRTIRINPKNLSSYEEANHCNLVFLSNERMPVVLEEDDRRHLVIYTPPPKSKAFYDGVVNEMYAGGAQALFYYLLHIDIGDFNEHTKPLMTSAKEDLINLSKESVARFADDIVAGELNGITLAPWLTEDLYDLYRHWCGRQGVKPSPMNHAIDKLSKRDGWQKQRKRYATGTRAACQRAFLLPPKAIEPPAATSEQFWLSQCVEEFRGQIAEYKAGGPS